MGIEKNFENRLRAWLHTMGVYQAALITGAVHGVVQLELPKWLESIIVVSAIFGWFSYELPQIMAVVKWVDEEEEKA